MIKEMRLLKAIFTENDGEDGKPNNYPETHYEKIDYAEFLLHQLLKDLNPALASTSRLRALLLISKEGGMTTLPDLITNNESRILLKKLSTIKRDIDDAIKQVCMVFENTKEACHVQDSNET